MKTNIIEVKPPTIAETKEALEALEKKVEFYLIEFKRDNPDIYIGEITFNNSNDTVNIEAKI